MKKQNKTRKKENKKKGKKTFSDFCSRRKIRKFGRVSHSSVTFQPTINEVWRSWKGFEWAKVWRKWRFRERIWLSMDCPDLLSHSICIFCLSIELSSLWWNIFFWSKLCWEIYSEMANQSRIATSLFSLWTSMLATFAPYFTNGRVLMDVHELSANIYWYPADISWIVSKKSLLQQIKL